MKDFTSRICFLFCLLSVLPLAFTSCSSSDEEIPKMSWEVGLTDFFVRYNLPRDKEAELQSYSIKETVDPSLLLGYNDNYEVYVIICDTVANKPLYVNYNQFTLPSSVEVSLPYGEKAIESPGSIEVRAASISKNLAASFKIGYGQAPSLYYRLFYSNGNIAILEASIEASVLKWFENTFLFYYRHYNGSKYPEELEYASCYNSEGQLCYEALYPSIDNLDLLNAKLIQPISISSAIGVNITSTKVDAFAINVEKHELLWHETATNSAYEYQVNDRMSYSNVSYSNNTLTFTVDILSYDGTKKSYDVAITADGSISFPTNG